MKAKLGSEAGMQCKPNEFLLQLITEFLTGHGLFLCSIYVTCFLKTQVIGLDVFTYGVKRKHKSRLQTWRRCKSGYPAGAHSHFYL